MESWLEMDQGDGFVDRDLTSSLTGAESFGSAHKNYQNALIRKKQSDGEDELENEGPREKLAGDVAARKQRKSMPMMEYPSYAYAKFVDNAPAQRAYDLPNGNLNGYQDESYRLRMMNKNGEGEKSGWYDNKYRNERYMSMMAGREMMPLRPSLREARGMQTYGHGSRRVMAKCQVCEPAKGYDAEMMKFRGGYGRDALEPSEYVGRRDDRLGRMKNDLGDADDLKEFQMDQLGDDAALENCKGDEDDEQGLEESEYYGEDRGPSLTRGAGDVLDIDYSQINPHGIIYKREENKPQGSNREADKGEEVSQGSINPDKSKSVKGSRRGTVLRAYPPKEGQEISKSDTKALLQNADMIWKMNSNLQSKELHDVMKDSQRALEEVQMFQQKLATKPQFNFMSSDWKRDMRGSKATPDDRNKREDEDEQKNMKTGTDEGGGEYEDEEGKGHNDEEEYYEEAELTGDKSRLSRGNAGGDNPTRKFFKREAGKDEHQKTTKENGETVDIASEDYVLTLENAPVEYPDKYKKSSYHEGVADKKNAARKGAKIWDEWGKWSPCSVTCGIGRSIRWRHCIGGGCAQGEKEAQIKKCTYPAC